MTSEICANTGILRDFLPAVPLQTARDNHTVAPVEVGKRLGAAKTGGGKNGSNRGSLRRADLDHDPSLWGQMVVIRQHR